MRILDVISYVRLGFAAWGEMRIFKAGGSDCAPSKYRQWGETRIEFENKDFAIAKIIKF